MTDNTVQLPRPVSRFLLPSMITFLGLYLVWLFWGRENPEERLLAGNMTLVFTALVVLTMALWTRARIAGSGLRRSWNWLCSGLVLWALSDLVRLLSVVAQPTDTLLFSFFDFLSLLGSIPFCIGLILYPRLPRPHWGRLQLFFDTTLVTASTLTMIWLVVLRPALLALGSVQSDSFRVLLYPMADLLIVLVLLNLFLLSNPRQASTSFLWIMPGVLAYAFSDLTYAALLAGNSYQPGAPLDAGWVLGDLFLLLGIAWQLNTPSAPSRIWQRLLENLQRAAPLIATLVIGWYTLLNWQLRGQLEPLGLWMTVILSLGLVARQGVVAGELEMQKYASLVNSVAEPAFVCDAQGRLQLVNPALLTAALYPNEKTLLGQPLQSLLHPEHETDLLLKKGLMGSWSGELHLRRRDGTLLPVSLALRPLMPAGDSRLALAGTAHDLSEQKRQQAALQAAYEQIAADRNELEILNTQLEQKVAEKTADLLQALEQLEHQNQALQQLDRLKSDFVSLVSHELRAPLTNISGGIEVLLSKGSKLPEQARRNLELVQGEIQRLSRFVETILDLSALDAGKLPLYLSPVSLQGVVSILQNQVRHLHGAERIHWNIPTDLPPALADEQALTSILFHLLDNALKYAPQGEIKVSAELRNEDVYVHVADQGPGIPPESMPFLFDRFYRLENSDSQSVYGHGLGLYIVKRLLTAMGSQITVQNQPQGGALFTFWLPCAIHQGAEDAL